MSEQQVQRVATAKARAVERRGERMLKLRWTDETYDDYRTVLLMDGWDFSRMFHPDGSTKNAPFLYQHGWAMPPLGEILNARIEVETERTLKRSGEKVKGRAYDCLVRFPKSRSYELSHLVFDLYAEGIMRATSAGFWPLERRDPTDEDVERFGIPEAERERAEIWVRNKLAEISAVTIPGNENAVKELGHLLVRNGMARRLGPEIMDGVVSKYSGILYPDHFTGRLNRILAKLGGHDVNIDWRQAKAKVQSVIFSKEVGDWTAEKAKSWLDEHDMKSDKMDETEQSFRFRQFPPDRCKEGTIVTLTEDMPAGVSMVSCEVAEVAEEAAPAPT